MRVVDLVKYLNHPEQLDDLYQEEGLNRESESLLVYLQEALDLWLFAGVVEKFVVLG